MNNYLITGADGFVGEHLVKELKGNVYGIGLSDCCEFLGKDRYFQCDITNADKLNQVIKSINPSYIYHLAGLSSVSDCAQHPADAVNINVNGFLNLLKSVRDNKIDSKILFVSSAHVYGNPDNISNGITEEVLINPESEYGMTKACCEILGRQFMSSYDLKIIFLRSFNHFGPGQRKGFFISDICSQIAGIEAGLIDPVIKTGNINVYRDLLDVRDVVNAYNLAMQKCKPGEIYNICSGRPVLLKDVLEKLISFSSKDIKVVCNSINIRNSDPKRLYGNNDKFVKETSWQICYDLGESLLDALSYWREKIILSTV